MPQKNKDKREEARKYRALGNSYAKIAKKMELSSPSLAHHYCKPTTEEIKFGDEYAVFWALNAIKDEVESVNVKTNNEDYVTGVRHAKEWFLEIIDKRIATLSRTIKRGD